MEDILQRVEDWVEEVGITCRRELVKEEVEEVEEEEEEEVEHQQLELEVPSFFPLLKHFFSFSVSSIPPFQKELLTLFYFFKSSDFEFNQFRSDFGIFFGDFSRS